MTISLNNQFNTEEINRFYCPTYIVNSSRPELLKDYIPDGKQVIVVHDEHINPDDYVVGAMGISLNCEPTEAMVESALQRLPNGEILVVAIGGGSAIDLAKAIVAFKKFGIWRRIGYDEHRYISDQKHRDCYFIAVPTTPATGSEVSRYFLIKDSISSEKLVGRSWSICPNVAFICPTFLRTLTVKQLAVAAFDAFIHSWETYFCKHETSVMIRLLAAEAMANILSSLSFVVLSKDTNDIPDEVFSRLQIGATLGGICLSNTRTGLLHTAGEAISSQINLPHPFTLRIFFNTSLDFYKKYYEEDFSSLSNRLAEDIKSLNDICIFWNRIWSDLGLEAELREQLKNSHVNLQALQDLIWRDQVLLTKEHLIAIDQASLSMYLQAAVNSYEISIR